MLAEDEVTVNQDFAIDTKISLPSTTLAGRLVKLTRSIRVKLDQYCLEKLLEDPSVNS